MFVRKNPNFYITLNISDDVDKTFGTASTKHLLLHSVSPLVAKTGNTIPDIDIEGDIRKIELTLWNKCMDLEKIKLSLTINYTVIGVIFCVSGMILFCLFVSRNRQCNCKCTDRPKDGNVNTSKMLPNILKEKLGKVKSCQCTLRMENDFQKLNCNKLPDCKDVPRPVSVIQTDKVHLPVLVDSPDCASDDYSGDIKLCECGPGCLCPAAKQDDRSCTCSKTSDNSNALI